MNILKLKKISIVCKHPSYTTVFSTLCCYDNKIYPFAFCVHQHRFITTVFHSCLLVERKKKKEYKIKKTHIYTDFCINLCSYLNHVLYVFNEFKFCLASIYFILENSHQHFFQDMFTSNEHSFLVLFYLQNASFTIFFFECF